MNSLRFWFYFENGFIEMLCIAAAKQTRRAVDGALANNNALRLQWAAAEPENTVFLNLFALQFSLHDSKS